MTHLPRTALLVLLGSLAACEDDGNQPLDMTSISTADMTAVLSDLSTINLDASIPEPMVAPVAVSATGHDRLLGVTYDASGNIYATGYVAPGTDAATDFSIVVAKFSSTGVLDTTFGTLGFATKNIIVGKGGEVARGIVIQSTGKIVVSATGEHAAAADERDRDTYLVRFNANGTLDTSFGDLGVKTINLSEGEAITGGYVADTTYGLTKYPGTDDRMIMMSAQKRTGATDLDFAVVRVTADGVLDTTFNGTGIATLDIANQSGTPRTANILADGSILASGYYTDTTDADIIKPVVWKVTAAGVTDTTFGGGDGIFSQTVLGHTTEVYAAALQGTKLVTIGYGKASAADDLDWISLRLNADGTLDNTYGTAGVATIDHAGFSDNARAMLVLPSKRLVFVGGGRTSATESDAMVAVLTENGTPDTTFSPTGKRTYDLGGASDFFWSAALSPIGDKVAIVGSKQVAAGMGNDDGALLLLPGLP